MLPGIVPAGFRAADGTVATYFEAAATITVLVLLAQVLELRAREQTGGTIRALLRLAPKTTRRLREDGGEDEIQVDQVAKGDHMRIRPARRCRWIAWCWRAAANSMSQCLSSPALAL